VPNPTDLIILHEDSLHKTFVAAFLAKKYRARFVRGPGNGGVKRKFPDQVRALLDRGSKAHLLVILDADGKSYKWHQDSLISSLEDEQRTRLVRSGRWQLICPNHSLDNWCRYLDGKESSERKLQKRQKYRDPDTCKASARMLAENCATGIELIDPVPSLAETCRRWRAYWSKNP
jgi:hypothetical protein